MLSWLGKQLMSWVMSRTRAGDIRPTLALEAPDVRFRFPGENSWAGEFNGKAAVERWLSRFARVGIQIFPDEVVVKGFPWKMTVCVRGHDYLKSPEGEMVYENRYVIWGRMAWGRLRDYEVYEDTEKARALDEYLAERDPALLAF
jgi:ketosteroid isomerase-like protein